MKQFLRSRKICVFFLVILFLCSTAYHLGAEGEGPPQVSRQINAYYLESLRLYRDGQYRKADDLMQRVMRIMQDDPETEKWRRTYKIQPTLKGFEKMRTQIQQEMQVAEQHQRNAVSRKKASRVKRMDAVAKKRRQDANTKRQTKQESLKDASQLESRSQKERDLRKEKQAIARQERKQERARLAAMRQKDLMAQKEARMQEARKQRELRQREQMLRKEAQAKAGQEKEAQLAKVKAQRERELIALNQEKERIKAQQIDPSSKLKESVKAQSQAQKVIRARLSEQRRREKMVFAEQKKKLLQQQRLEQRKRAAKERWRRKEEFSKRQEELSQQRAEMLQERQERRTRLAQEGKKSKKESIKEDGSFSSKKEVEGQRLQQRLQLAEEKKQRKMEVARRQEELSSQRAEMLQERQERRTRLAQEEKKSKKESVRRGIVSPSNEVAKEQRRQEKLDRLVALEKQRQEESLRLKEREELAKKQEWERQQRLEERKRAQEESTQRREEIRAQRLQQRLQLAEEKKQRKMEVARRQEELSQQREEMLKERQGKGQRLAEERQRQQKELVRKEEQSERARQKEQERLLVALKQKPDTKVKAPVVQKAAPPKAQGPRADERRAERKAEKESRRQEKVKAIVEKQAARARRIAERQAILEERRMLREEEIIRRREEQEEIRQSIEEELDRLWADRETRRKEREAELQEARLLRQRKLAEEEAQRVETQIRNESQQRRERIVHEEGIRETEKELRQTSLLHTQQQEQLKIKERELAARESELQLKQIAILNAQREKQLQEREEELVAKEKELTKRLVEMKQKDNLDIPQALISSASPVDSSVKGHLDPAKVRQIEELWIQARRLYSQGHYDAAIRNFQKIVELEGNPRIKYTPYAKEYIEKARGKVLQNNEISLVAEIGLIEQEMINQVIVEQRPPYLTPRVRKEEAEMSLMVEPPPIRRQLKKRVVTLDFDKVDFKSVMTFLTQESGINIVASQKVLELGLKVTIYFKETPVYDVIKYLTKSLGLLYRVDKEVVWIAHPDEVGNEMLETKIYYLTKGGGLFTEFTPLTSSSSETGLGGSSAQISKMLTIEDTLKLAVPWPEESKLTYDKRLNALIVRNTPQNLQVIEDILYTLDVTPLQILIEAKFIEIDVTNTKEFGLEWKLNSDFAITKHVEHPNGPLVTGLEADSGVDFTSFTNAAYGLNLTYKGVLTRPQFQTVLHLLENNQKTKTLSSPRITTLNNQLASIKIVDEWIYPTRYEYEVVQSDVNGDGDFADAGETTYKNVPKDFLRRDVGILLKVIPAVGSDRKTISLSLIPEVSEGSAGGFNYTGEVTLPLFTSRNLSTSVVVNSGDTVVLGGLIKETRTTTNSKVPFFGDLPVVGKFFNKDYDTVTRKNLLIFVTAKVLSPEGEEIRVVQK